MEDKPIRELTGTDIRWIAKGYWEKYFVWRIHPKVKTPLAVAVLLGVLFFITAIASSASVAPGEQAPIGVILPVALTGIFLVIAIFWSLNTYCGCRDEFIDRAVQQWEKGSHEIPDYDSILKHLDEENRSGR